MIFLKFLLFSLLGGALGAAIGAWAFAQDGSPSGPISRLIAPVAGALIGVVAALFEGAGPLLVLGLGLGLLAVALVDYRLMLVPDALVLPLGLTGLVAAGVRGADILFLHAAAAGIGFALIWLVGVLLRSRQGQAAVGMGDATLLAAIGAWVGPDLLPLVLLAAGLTGIAGLGLAVATGVAGWRTPLPFAPALALAGWSTFVLSQAGVA